MHLLLTDSRQLASQAITAKADFVGLGEVSSDAFDSEVITYAQQFVTASLLPHRGPSIFGLCCARGLTGNILSASSPATYGGA